MWRTPLHSVGLARAHVVIAVGSILIYAVAMWGSGITQGVLQMAFEADGRLKAGSFEPVVNATLPWLWLRLGAGVLYLAGFLLMAWNLVQTMRAGTRPADDAVRDDALGRDVLSRVLTGMRTSWFSAFGVIASGVKRHPNAELIDWHSASDGRPELFVSDGVHLQPPGQRLYADMISDRVEGD